MQWFIFILILPHLKPPCLEYLWPAIDTVFNAGRLISALVIIALHFFRNKFPSLPVWIMLILQGWIFFSTVCNEGYLWGCFLRAASILAVALIIDFFAERPTDMLASLFLCFELLIYLNFFSVLVYYPSGMYLNKTFGTACYFLGYHNSFILYVLPASFISLLYMKIKKFRSILLITIGYASIIITWSATSICGLLVFTVVLFVGKWKVFSWITFQKIFVGTLIIDVCISAFRVMNLPWIARIIEFALHKQATLTARTWIWDGFYNLFGESPWIGYGADKEVIVGTGYSAHNQWFQFLLEGGIVGILLFLLVNIAIGSRLLQFRNSPHMYIFYATFAAMFIIFIADVYMDNPWLYIPYIIAYHIDKFEDIPIPNHRRFRIILKRGSHVPNRKFS